MADNQINFGSVCSGIEAASVAWEQIGWSPAWFAEIEPFPSAVLAHHYPNVPNLGDMTTIAARIAAGEVEAPDALVGGTPCQAFSVAGLRGGLSDERGQLTLSYVELANAIDAARAVRGDQPSIIVWENVPGVLSSKDNAFGCFLGALAGEDSELQPPGRKWSNAGCVFGPQRAVAWRILDAQYFGVAQRRRRVFVVASARDGFDPAAVLFEFDSMRRDTPPSREAGQGFATDVAPSLTASGRGVERVGETRGQDPVVAQCLPTGTGQRYDPETETILPVAFNSRQDPVSGDVSSALDTCSPQAQAVAVRTANTGANGHGISPELAHTLDQAQGQAVAFTAINDGGDCQADVTPTLTCGGGGGHGVGMAAAFVQNSRDEVRLMGGDGQIVGALAAETGAKQQCYVAQPVSIRGRDGGATAELGDEVGNCLRASSGGGDKPYVLVNQSQIGGQQHANAEKTRPIEALRILREAIGEEAFCVWSLGILAALQPAQVLQSSLHGTGFRCATFSRSWVVYCALSRQEDSSAWLLQSLRETECEGCPPQGWEPSEQLTRELGAYLSELSQPGAQAARFVRDLREASEGSGLLRQALSAVQEVGRSSGSETQSAHRTYAVRRLTVEECEFLQGFPRGYTQVPYRNKPAADGPRYKALGNSMAVPCMSWIGRRIDVALREVAA